MDSLVTILQRHLEDTIAPQELGRRVARECPRNWKISVVAVTRARVPRSMWKGCFQGFIEEQNAKPKKFKGSKKKGAPVEEELDDQLDLLDEEG